MREFVGAAGYEGYSSPDEIVGYAVAAIKRAGIYGETVVGSYLNTARRLAPDERVTHDTVSYFFMPGRWLKPNEIALFSKIGRGQWHINRLTPQNRLGIQRIGQPRIIADIDNELRVVTKNQAAIEGLISAVWPKDGSECDATEAFYDVFDNLDHSSYLPEAERLAEQAEEEMSDIKPGWHINPEDMATKLVHQDFLNDFYSRVAETLHSPGKLARITGQLKLRLGATSLGTWAKSKGRSV